MKRTALVLGLVLAALAMTACPPATGTDPIVPDPSIALTVVDSVNGTGVSGVSVVVYDELGAQIMSATTDASGYAPIIADPLERITIVANKSECAESTLIMNAGDDGVIIYKALVLKKLGMITREAVAPEIATIAVSRDSENLGTNTPFDGATALSTEGETYILVTVYGSSAVEPTAWSGFGVKMGIDIGADDFNGMAGTLINGPTLIASGDYAGMYESFYLFNLSDMEFNAGEHVMNLVAYDVANNRTELVQPINLLAHSGAVAVPLDGCAFSDMKADLRAYGLSRQFFGKEKSASTQAMVQYDGNSTTYRTKLTFKFRTAVPEVHQAIRGFRVYRAAGSSAYKLVSTVNYGTLVASADDDELTEDVNESVSHSYFDSDSMLQPGVVYSYQIEAFTDNATLLRSDAISAKVYQPFTASLVGPTNRGTVTSDPVGGIGPEFSFSISNTALWNATQSDFFYFALTVNEKVGSDDYYGRFRYNFTAATPRFEFLNSGNWYPFSAIGVQDAWVFEYANGVITFVDGWVPFISPTNLFGAGIDYKVGTAYEWDIIGDLSIGDPCWFEKAYTGGVAKSFGDAYSEGANTLNGRFEFVVSE